MAENAQEKLELEIHQQDEAAVITVKGPVGIGEAEEFRATLERLAEKPWSLIVLDLGAMDFICSSGLGAIISTHLRLRRHGGNVKLARPPLSIRQVLETTRLNHLFGIYDSVQDAIASHDFNKN